MKNNKKFLSFLTIFIVFIVQFLYPQKIVHSKFSYIDWSEPYEIEKVRVIHVADGDTVQDDKGRWIRLLGVDTPEVMHPEWGILEAEPGAVEATNFTIEQVEKKQVLLLIQKNHRYDVYNRILALVFYEDQLGKTKCLSWELVKYGYAKVLILSDNTICKEWLWRDLEKAAKRKTYKDFIYLAEQCLEEGLEYDAIEIYKSAIKKFPEQPQLYINLARLYKSLNMIGFAIDIYHACLEKFPNLNYIRRELAICYERMMKIAGPLSLVNYKDKAKEEWRKLLGTEYDREAKKKLKELK